MCSKNYARLVCKFIHETQARIYDGALLPVYSFFRDLLLHIIETGKWAISGIYLWRSGAKEQKNLYRPYKMERRTKTVERCFNGY